jgi:tetratricopeptide (TPR) repeat protein
VTRVLHAAATLLGLLALTLTGGVARAADEGQVLRLRAEQLAAQGRCTDALPVARKARALDAGDARAALLEGQCAIRLKRYGEAIAPLEDARRLDPGLSRAALYLGIAHYHQGDLDRAEAELAAAAGPLGDNAELQLYRGLVLLERARATEAAEALERAAALDPRTADPAASYFAGRAWQSADQRERAARALRRVIAQAPGTPWATEAERALASSEARYRRQAPWGIASAGIEYDDNVVLLDDVTADDDWRGVWFLAGGVELFRNAGWAGGVIADYNGSAHGDLHDFDSHFPAISIWLDRSLDDDTYLRLQPDFGYRWLGTDPFLAVYGATLALHRAWGEAGSGRAFVRYAHRDYRYDVPVDPTGDPKALNRDAEEYGGGYEHVYPAGSETELRGGFQINRYDARGREYKHTGYEVWLGGRRELPLGLVGDLGAGYRYAHYDNASGFTIPPRSWRRRDHVFHAQALLERPITEHVELSARYRYQDNDSNVRVFDYDRHIVGGYVTVTFGGS